MNKTFSLMLALIVLLSVTACTPINSTSGGTTTGTIQGITPTEATPGNTEGTGTTQPSVTEPSVSLPVETQPPTEVVLPQSGSKLSRDFDSRSSRTVYYINVDNTANKPYTKKWGTITVTDGVEEYLDYLESLGFKITITGTIIKEPYTGFTTYETNFTVSNSEYSWKMYLYIQDEDYVEYQLDIYLEIGEPESIPGPTKPGTPEPEVTEPTVTEPPETIPEESESNEKDSEAERLFSFERKGDEYCVVGLNDPTQINIVIPDTYRGLPVTTVGSWAFAYNESIVSVTFSENLDSIEECAFEQCYGLKNIVFGNGIATIGKSAFRVCTGLSKVTIPGNVKTIGASAFEGCKSLSSITISNGVTTIESSAFAGTAIKSIEIPNSVSKIGEGLFNSCSSLTTAIVGSGITNLSTGTFCYCDSLTKVTLPSSLTTIGIHAFADCKLLKSITIPANIKIIGDGAFSACRDLTDFYFAGIKSAWMVISLGIDWNLDVPATNVICSDGIISLTGESPADPTEPPTAPPTEPPETEPPTTEPSPPSYEGVTIFSGTETISDTTIDGDVYITSTGNITFKNVTVNGNVYCYGKLTVSGGSANNLYAYYWDLGGITASCNAWDGVHGLVKGAFKTCGSVVIEDGALDYAFIKWGKR